MRSRAAVAALLAASVALVASPARAQITRAAGGKHCLEEPERLTFVKQTFGVQLNPTGAEHQLTLGVCQPLFTGRGVLFDYTNVQLGLVNYLSPAYVHQGGYVSVSPISPLELRMELTGVGLWPIPINGAGYYPFTSYHDDARPEERPKGKGDRAGGVEMAASAVLRGAIPVSARLKILLLETLALETWRIGDAHFYYNLRRDVMLARTDTLFRSSALAVAQLDLDANIALRLGPMDELQYVPNSGYVGNIAGGFATVLIRKLGRSVHNFQPFFRGGVHTHHTFRQGQYTLLLGVDLFYALGSR